MLDLTNQNHKRGVMVLNSKDVRIIDNTLFDWKVHTGCAENYAEMLINRVERLEISDSEKDDMLAYLGFIQNWIKESGKDIDKARDVFK